MIRTVCILVALLIAVSTQKLWQDDRRCGPKYPLPNGEPAQCDGEGEYPCCSSYSYRCWGVKYCHWSWMTDYRVQELVSVTRKVVGEVSQTRDDAPSIATCDQEGEVVASCDLDSGSMHLTSSVIGEPNSDGLKMSDDGKTCTAFRSSRGPGVQAAATCAVNTMYTSNCNGEVPRYVFEKTTAKLPEVRCPAGYKPVQCVGHSQYEKTIWGQNSQRISAKGEVALDANEVCKMFCNKYLGKAQCTISLICELNRAAYDELPCSDAKEE